MTLVSPITGSSGKCYLDVNILSVVVGHCRCKNPFFLHVLDSGH